jgi:hypothetical protein
MSSTAREGVVREGGGGGGRRDEEEEGGRGEDKNRNRHIGCDK